MQKVFLITGATSGIGRVAAEEIAKTGATVVITSRDERKGAEVVSQIIKSSANPNVSFIYADFASLQSVQRCALDFQAMHSRLDVLINNAGTWEMDFKESRDGIEMNWAVNHLATFLLTTSLLDVLKNSPAARIINTASMAHRRNLLQWDDLEFRQNFNGFYAYSQSKLANILFTVGLAKRLKDTNITVNSLHPGLVRTALFDKMTPEQLRFFGDGFITPQEGARTTLHLALSDQVEGITNQYWADCQPAKATDMALDQALAEKLWTVSEHYVEKALSVMI